MYDRILVPIAEGADLSVTAPARLIARRLGCALTLLHVHHSREAPQELEGLPQYRYQGVVESWDERDVAAEAHELEWLSALADRVAEAEDRLAVAAEVVHAPLARTLARESESALVVVPTTCPRELDGPVREVIRAGGAPVLLVPEGVEPLEEPRILVTLDGSRFSEEILPHALDLARATRGRLTLLEVVTQHTGIVRMLRPGERSPESAERFLREVRGRIPEELGAVDVRVVEEGNAAAGIAREARREDAGLVAMATHGRGGLRRLLLGSVAESVVQLCQVPMLLYRPVGSRARAGAPAFQPAERAPAG